MSSDENGTLMHKPPDVPGYEIQERIGEGGMGEVYRARQLSLQRTVAIKFLSPLPGGQCPLLAAHREALLMGSLTHPNIVTIYDCGELDGRYYLVMEHVAGPSLRSLLLPGKPWPIRKAAPLLDTIARALTAIHEQGILHLDLKPENVLCAPDGTIKVTDFGLAVPRVDARTLSGLGLAMGTIDYCAPEQRFGLPIDQRADLFSLATLAYEMLTGRLPGRYYRSATRENPALPRQVDDVLRRGLARDSSDRCETVEEFRRDLLEALRYRTSRGSNWALLGVGVGVLLFGLVLGAGWLGRPPVITIGFPPASVQPASRAWLLYDRPETLGWLEGEGELRVPPHLDAELRRIQLTDMAPGQRLDPQLPAWPVPLPALVIHSPGNWCFFHPLDRRSLAQDVLNNWPQLMELPRLSDTDNLLQAGSFDDNCLSFSVQTGIWRVRNSQRWQAGDQVLIDVPSDRPENPALVLAKRNLAGGAGRDINVYQRQRTVPRGGREIMILRYRARTEEGEARLSIGPRYALLLPKEERSPVAERLLGLSVPHRYLDSTPAADSRDYWLINWVTPTPEWQTYYSIWEWPPHVADQYRNIEVLLSGFGKVWVDDVELLTWDSGIRP